MIFGAFGALGASMVIGLFVGTPALRLRGDYLGIMTLGFNMIVVEFFNNFEPTGKSFGLRDIPEIVGFGIAF